MASSSRDRISVDLHGLGAAVIARARERGVTVSTIVRDAVAQSLPSSGAHAVRTSAELDSKPPSSGSLLRLSLRVTREAIARLDAGARAAGLSRSAFVSGLVDGVSILSTGGRPDHLAALIRASAELSTLSRNVRHLADLMRSSEFSAAREYRGMLDSLAGDIAGHLELAGTALSEMSPTRRNVRRGHRFGRGNKETI